MNSGILCQLTFCVDNYASYQIGQGLYILFYSCTYVDSLSDSLHDRTFDGVCQKNFTVDTVCKEHSKMLFRPVMQIIEFDGMIILP